MSAAAPKHAGIYCRISQDRSGEGLGVARQEADCRALAEQMGWGIGEVFVDDDTSAYSGKGRPAYQRLLKSIRSQEVDGLIVWNPDRLHRSPLELEDFIGLVQLTRIPIATVMAGHYDLTTAAGQMTARVVGAVARHESDVKSERIRRKQVELAEAGKSSGGGRRPFGFDADRVTVREEEAALIREAAARVLAGEGLNTIAKEWTRKGIPTVSGLDRWAIGTVKRMLLRARLSGQREHHGRITAVAEWPAILTPTQTQQLRALLNDPRRGSRAPQSYLLTGLMVCGGCGARMVPRAWQTPSGKRYPRYICSVDRGGCNKVGIHAGHAESYVTERLFLALDEEALARAARAKAAPRPGPDPEERLATLERRSSELAQLWAAGELTRSEWMVARDQLGAETEKVRRLVAETVEAHAAARWVGRSAELRAAWGEMALAQRRAICRAMLAEVTVAPVVKGAGRFESGRLGLVWRD